VTNHNPHPSILTPTNPIEQPPHRPRHRHAQPPLAEEVARRRVHAVRLHHHPARRHVLAAARVSARLPPRSQATGSGGGGGGREHTYPAAHALRSRTTSASPSHEYATRASSQACTWAASSIAVWALVTTRVHVVFAAAPAGEEAGEE